MGRKVLFAFFSHILLVLLFCSFCQAQPIEKVTIAYNVGNPPLKFKDAEGNAAGILIDIWRLWGKRVGVAVEFKEALFEQTLSMVREGEADIHAGLFYTEERDQFLDYSSPLMDLSYHVFYHKSLPQLNSIKEVRPYRTGVPKGYTHNFVQKEMPSAALAVFENFPALYESAVSGDINVFVSPHMNLEYFLIQKGIPNDFRCSGSSAVYSRTYLGAVKEGNGRLQKFINDGMKLIGEDELVAIEKNWLKRTRGTGDVESLLIACDSDYAPFTFLNSRGKPAGLFVYIWKEWAKREKVKVEFVFDNWERSIESVKNGLADFHSGFHSDRDWSLSSDEFYRTTARVFFRCDKEYGKLSDLDDCRVASISSYYGEVLKKANPAIEFVLVRNFSELFRKLGDNTIDAFIDDELAVDTILHRQGRQLDFRKLRDFSHESSISAVAKKGNWELIKHINRGLQAISRDSYTKIEKRWLRKPSAGYYHRLRELIKLTDEERQWLVDHPVVRIGVDRDYAPYCFVNEQGEFCGVAADYAHIISRKLGQKFEMVKGLSWPEILAGAREKTVDLVVAAARRPEREEYMAFSKGYILTPQVIMSRVDDNRIRSRDDLKGLSLALVREYSTSETVKEDFPGIQVIDVNNAREGLLAVAMGKADAYVGVLGINIYHSNKNGISNLKVAAVYDLNPNEQCCGVRKDWAIYTSILDKVLDSISESEKAQILSRWINFEQGNVKTVKRPELTEDEKAFISKHPEIRFAFDPEFFPFEFRDKNEQYSGMVSDYIAILNERLGLNMDVVHGLSWKEAVAGVQKGNIDVLPCIGKTAERETFLNFSKSYISFQRVVIARSDFPFIGSLDELKKVTVAVQENSSHAGFIREKTNIIAKHFPTLQAALHAVSSGKADVFIGNLASSTYWIRRHNLTNLKVAAPAQAEKQALYFGIRKDWPELVSIINKGLASLSHDEENRIYRKWVLVKYQPGIAPTLVFYYLTRILAGVIFCFLIFSLWNYRLKMEVDQRKAAEGKLQHYTVELEKANVHLSSLDKLKSMFIASMSHELRTPLNSIIGFTGVLLQGMTGELNERQRDQLTRVYRSSKHLLALISDVIDISKIEAGRADVFPREFVLGELVDEAVENVTPLVGGKEIEIELDVSVDLELMTDRKRLLQVLINFLSNAVKYTEVGTVHVRAFGENGQLVLRVSDTGIGIGEKDKEKLFEAFERLDSHLRVKAGGTGLGLYLTRKLVTELLGGTIIFESELNKGSTFGLRIPLDITHEKEGGENEVTGD